MRRAWTLVLMVVAGAVAGGCDAQKFAGSATAPSASNVVSLLGLWASSSSSTQVAKLATCGNFQFNVTNQTGTTLTGQFSAVCLGTYQVTGTASGQLNGGTLHLVLNASANLPQIGVCPVTLTTDGTLEGDTIRLPYTAQTCIGTYSGTETLRKSSLFPSPTPAPTPTPTPDPTPEPTPVPTVDPSPTPQSADEIDLNQVTIVLGPKNIGSWPQTSTMTGVTTTNGLCTYHTKLGHWPTVGFFDTGAPIDGNQWVFANINGHWYGGAGEWQRPAQACKDVDANSIGSGSFYSTAWEPLYSWVPRPGEVFGVMETTPARAWPDMRTIDERSNVILVRWGQ